MLFFLGKKRHCAVIQCPEVADTYGFLVKNIYKHYVQPTWGFSTFVCIRLQFHTPWLIIDLDNRAFK